MPCPNYIFFSGRGYRSTFKIIFLKKIISGNPGMHILLLVFGNLPLQNQISSSTMRIFFYKSYGLQLSGIKILLNLSKFYTSLSVSGVNTKSKCNSQLCVINKVND